MINPSGIYFRRTITTDISRIANLYLHIALELLS